MGGPTDPFAQGPTLEPIEVYEEDGKVVKRYPPRWATGAVPVTVEWSAGWNEMEGE